MDKYLCTVIGCTETPWARGWCAKHYARWNKTGSPLGTNRPTVRSEALLSKVDTSREHWMWTGTTLEGYGIFNWRKTKAKAHRAVYELLEGPIPQGLELDHLCQITLCVRPSHLEPVTHRVNILRGSSPAAVNARKTHCLNGHEYTPETAYERPGGGRRCRTCRNERERKGSDAERRIPTAKQPGTS